MVEAARSLQGLIEMEENDGVRMIYDAGNYMLPVPYFKFQVGSTQWHSRSKEKRTDHVQKFSDYCPAVSDFYPKL